MDIDPMNKEDVSKYLYTSNYCEENVYFLCKRLIEEGIADATGTDLFVVFISNDKKQVPLWRQKASSQTDGAIVWDYHVVCVQKRKKSDSVDLVWDLDATIPFPATLSSYFDHVIVKSSQILPEDRRLFRVVHAPVFIRSFASDRSHMKDSEGNWFAPPPPYDPIISEDGSLNNLHEFMEIHAVDGISKVDGEVIDLLFTQKFGIVLNEFNFEEFFSQIS